MSVSWLPSITTRTCILAPDLVDPIIGQLAAAGSLHKGREFPLLVVLEKEVPQSHHCHIHPLLCGFQVASYITSTAVVRLFPARLLFGAGPSSLFSSLKVKRVIIMNSFLLFSLLLNGFYFTTRVTAQDSTSSASLPAPTTFVYITPEMSASSVSSFFNALATATPEQPGEPLAGDVGSTAGAGDSDAGAAGKESGSITISTTGIIAIAVCVSVIALFGSM